MTVARRGERKVALVARLVQRALHAAQKQRVDERCVGRTGGSINCSLQLIGAPQGNTGSTAIVDDA